MSEMIYFFGAGEADGDKDMRELLGGKGAGLAEMASLGLPVPPGFTITTEACLRFYDGDDRFRAELRENVLEAVTRLEKATGKTFGAGPRPLLLSVRSGARASMPGMMDSVLNLGLTRATVDALTELSGDRRFALDCRRRLIQMYGNVVHGLPGAPYEQAIVAEKRAASVEADIELDAAALERLVARFEQIHTDAAGAAFPDDPREQLLTTVEAVFQSWNNARAIAYRKLNHIPHDWGTAANVQSMVFGNLGPGSATGVAFTRDPATGDKRFVGEYLRQAQGEDVVAGIRTPNPIVADGSGRDSLDREMAQPYAQLMAVQERLERHYRDMQDIEFTIEEGELYILQTRSGKRTGFAQVRIAVDMVDEGLIDETTAVGRVEPESLIQLLAPVFEPAARAAALSGGMRLTSGLPAGPGAACGRVVFSPEKAVDMVHNKREKVILVRTETSPEDIEGMSVAEGILTARGGMTSHAAVVARGMGKPCIVGAHEMAIDYDRKRFKVGDRVVESGDWISIDGTSGDVIAGQLALHPSEVAQVLIDETLDPSESLIHRCFERLMAWADARRRLGVRANADTPDDALAARALGAAGIGLCRTEHMFFHADRIRAVREMILAEDATEREAALTKIQPFQKEDFVGLFRVMNGLPVTIRLLDPPLHEFLPDDPELLAELAKVKGVPLERVRERVEELHESNPMLGHRGCRLAMTYPEVYDAQVRAIIEAAVEVVSEGVEVHPEIMLPIVGAEQELKILRVRVDEVASEVLARRGVSLAYLVGTMIELPRAALVADKLAEHAAFFSFGTNDLTQMTFGYSRDDAERSFLRHYVETGVLASDPFQTLDVDGVGQLVRLGTEQGRRHNPSLKVGVCGEHGGDPRSIAFFHSVGLDYVSCSPRRVPVARLAAAQAAIGETAGEAQGRT